MNSRKYETNDYKHDLDFANHLALLACFMSSKKWVHVEKYSSKACLIQCLGKILSIIGQDPSVHKSNWLHGVIFLVFLINVVYSIDSSS